MRSISKLFLLGVLGSVSLFGSVPGGAAVADETPPPIEENHDYPLAEAIFQQRGIRLIKGDGHILFTDCVAGADQLKVVSRRWPGAQGEFCFRIRGAKGYLTLEVPEAYLIRGDSHTVAAKVTVDGDTESVTVPKNTWVGVGEGSDPDSGPATVVELRVA